jgi:hypothetical protein
MPRLDLYRKHRAEYASPRRPVLLTVKPARYLAISGRGDPQGAAFGRAVGALYAMAFTIKMASKAAGRDYVVSKLEGLWWGQRRGRLLLDEPRHAWRWTLLIRTPDFVTPAQRAAAVRQLVARGKDTLVARVKLERLEEGRCVQALHVGPYDEERRTLEAMHALAAERGLLPDGKHHEIYLSDPRRVSPERLRTILRQPVR